jgi:hypothetical protein
MGAFRRRFNNDLVGSGEFVDARGLGRTGAHPPEQRYLHGRADRLAP